VRCLPQLQLEVLGIFEWKTMENHGKPWESMEFMLWHAVMGNQGFGMVLVMICVLHGYPLGCFNGMAVVWRLSVDILFN
jgi:hypothetical protein